MILKKGAINHKQDLFDGPKYVMNFIFKHIVNDYNNYVKWLNNQNAELQM
jgi:hypothetical protein